MDTRKVTLIATIAVIALVAVGVGYAYTATTENSGNNAESEHVVLSQSTDGAYQFVNSSQEIVYDTKTVGTRGAATSTTTYKISDNVTTVNTYTVAKIGDSFKLDAAATNITGDLTDLSITMTSENITVTQGWVVVVKVEAAQHGSETPATSYAVYSNNGTSSSWTGNTFALDAYDGDAQTAGNQISYESATITVYYGYATSDHTNGLTTPPAPNPFNSGKLIFTYTNNKVNPEIQ